MPLEIKGIRIPGLTIKLDPYYSFEQNLAELKVSLDQNFTGDKKIILDCSGLSLSKNQQLIVEMLLKDYNTDILAFKNQTSSDLSESNTNKSKLKIETRNLRSGQSIIHNGDVLVIGSVNPDASIKASGNILVLGQLRGSVHAGYNGDKENIVIATKMNPQKICIGEICAIGLEHNPQDVLQKAYVHNDMIYLEQI